MFPHKYVDFSAISVMGRRCVAPSLKADRHIPDKFLPLLAAVLRYSGRRPAVEANKQERGLESTEMEVNIPKCFMSEDWDLVHQALLTSLNTDFLASNLAFSGRESRSMGNCPQSFSFHGVHNLKV